MWERFFGWLPLIYIEIMGIRSPLLGSEWILDVLQTRRMPPAGAGGLDSGLFSSERGLGR
jgi:hypothetical protein